MFSELPADESVSNETYVRNVELTGPDASASITTGDGNVLIPVRIVASGTSPTRTIHFQDTADAAITSDSGFAQIIQEIGQDGFGGVCTGMTATSDSDAASGDPAEVQAIELNVNLEE